MPKVTQSFINRRESDYDKCINLYNGNYVLAMGADGREYHYMVTSFRNDTGRSYKKNIPDYCSLINLETGTLPFREPSSRRTTFMRLIRHLNSAITATITQVVVVDRKKYEIDVSFHENDVTSLVSAEGDG